MTVIAAAARGDGNKDKIAESTNANQTRFEWIIRGGFQGIENRSSGIECDNLAACFSRELADYTIQVIDVAGGDKIPRKGGPGITQTDLLVINKTDLAEAVGAD